MTSAATLGTDYFDEMYAASADPWGFTTRWYETRKYAISLAMLPAQRYGTAFEPGCSIGVFTEQLAARCDRVLACDGSAAAVRSAGADRGPALCPGAAAGHPARLAGRGVRPDRPVRAALLLRRRRPGQVLGRAAAALRPGGTLLAVHWRHPVAEYPRSGDEVHRALAAQAGLARLAEHREPDFLAEVYLRADGEPVSVAQAGGLV